MKTISSKKSTLKFFGARLKQLRLQNGLTQREVAEKLSIFQSAYSKKEKGIYNSTCKQLFNICKLFDVSADYLLGLTEY